MNPAVSTLIAVLGVIIAAIPIYYLARSNAREAKRMREADTQRAVSAATGPLKQDLIEARQREIELRTTLRERDRRIDELEDELRRAGR